MHKISDGRSSIGDLEGFIHHLRGKGVILWMDESGLRYRAPKGVLTGEDRQALIRANGDIAPLLQCHAKPPAGDSLLRQITDARRGPLSFTQLDHWYDRLRGDGRPVRDIASAFHLSGLLRVDLLKEAVAAAGRRHDALRTRIVVSDQKSPIQEVSDKYRADLEVIRLGPLPDTQERLALEGQIRSAILDADDYAESPLFKAVLFVINASEHVFVLAMDHIISDLTSLHLLTEEVFTAYAQLLQRLPIDLPKVLIQFPDHAARLRARSPEMLSVVVRKFQSIPRVHFPDDLPPSLAGRVGSAFVRFAISKNLVNALYGWARRHRTTVVLAALTAYSALLLRWCNVSEIVIPFMTDGRTSAELERTIGYLAFNVFVKVGLEKRNTFMDLLEVVTEAYCRAHDEADFAYATARVPESEFTRNAAVNWLPAESARDGIVNDARMALSCSSIDLSTIVLRPAAEYDREPVAVFSERGGAIEGLVRYPRNRFSERGMERFATKITEFLTAMLNTPTQHVMDMEL